MDEGANAEPEVGDGKNRGDGLGVDGEGSLSGAVESGGEFEEGAGSAEEGKETHQQCGVHDVLAEVFLLAKEAENEKGGAQIGWDQGGFMDSSGEEKGPQAHGNIENREDSGDFRHDLILDRVFGLGEPRGLAG